MALALIPARGGSKGIPRKNIKSFAGHPLLAWSIVDGINAGLRVIVSTDDEEIAEIAKVYGAEVPFLRPAEIAGDATLDLPVFQHALTWLKENENYVPDMVVHLRPTAPIRPEGIIEKAVETLVNHPEASSVRGITPALQNPYKMWLVHGDVIDPVIVVKHESYNAPRQELPKAYAHTGLIDVVRSETVMKGSMSGDVIVPVFYSNIYSVDIDTVEDWEKAEKLYEQIRDV